MDDLAEYKSVRKTEYSEKRTPEVIIAGKKKTTHQQDKFVSKNQSNTKSKTNSIRGWIPKYNSNMEV